MTSDDRILEHVEIVEIVNGEQHVSSLPSGRTARAIESVARRIGFAFDEDVDGSRGWWVAIRPEIHLGPDVFVPDVAGWRRERVPEYSSGPAWEVAPDWVCEVLSPKTARFDRIVKLPKYARHQVAWAWLIDPALQTLEIFRLEHGQWVLASTHAGDDVIRPEPFDAVDFSLGSLWLNPASA